MEPHTLMEITPMDIITAMGTDMVTAIIIMADAADNRQQVALA